VQRGSLRECELKLAELQKHTLYLVSQRHAYYDACQEKVFKLLNDATDKFKLFSVQCDKGYIGVGIKKHDSCSAMNGGPCQNKVFSRIQSFFDFPPWYMKMILYRRRVRENGTGMEEMRWKMAGA